MNYKFGYKSFMLFQGIGGGISMWLYISGISMVFSLMIAVFLVIAMWVGPRLLDIERPCKDSPTLLLDGIVVILSWSYFFFIPNKGLCESILPAIAFMACLTDMVLWAKAKRQQRQIASVEARLCVTEALSIVAWAGYGISEVILKPIDISTIGLILLCLTAIALVGHVALKALRREAYYYDEMSLGMGLDIVLAVFIVYDFITGNTDFGLTNIILFAVLLIIDFVRSVMLRK